MNCVRNLIKLLLQHTFAASTRSHKEEADILDRGLSKVEAFKNVTISELPPKQLQIVDNVAQKLNVTLDDMQLSMRLYAADAPWLRQLNAQVSIRYFFFIFN